MSNAEKVSILQKESYLAAIKNSVGTHLFRNLYAVVDGEQKDLTKDGVASCAVFVSSLLALHHLIDVTRAPHATVAGLEANLKNSGWTETKKPQEGDLLIWEPMQQVDTISIHAGFYLDEQTAISNDWQTRVPAAHHLTYGTKPDGSPVRAITTIYTYDFKN